MSVMALFMMMTGIHIMITNQIAVAYGGGVDSTAMLIKCVQKGIKIDLILFADTGSEKPHTYEYVKYFNKYLIRNNQPQIIVVKKGGIQETLEQECLRAKCLPSMAYGGFKICSLKYKVQPQDKFCNNYEQFKLFWKQNKNNKVTKFIGIDADEAHRAKYDSDKKYKYKYPLIDWDMGRDECIQAIQDAGLKLPGKSACFFCPSSKIGEVRALKHQYPALFRRAIAMENNAELTSIKGLGRNYSWANVDQQDEMDFAWEKPCGCYDG